MIQSLENFVSMVIQGKQIPMYIKHTLFLYFSFFYMEKKKKTKQKLKTKPNKNMLNKTMQSIKLDANAWKHDSKNK